MFKFKFILLSLFFSVLSFSSFADQDNAPIGCTCTKTDGGYLLKTLSGRSLGLYHSGMSIFQDSADLSVCEKAKQKTSDCFVQQNDSPQTTIQNIHITPSSRSQDINSNFCMLQGGLFYTPSKDNYDGYHFRLFLNGYSVIASDDVTVVVEKIKEMNKQGLCYLLPADCKYIPGGFMWDHQVSHKMLYNNSSFFGSDHLNDVLVVMQYLKNSGMCNP